MTPQLKIAFTLSASLHAAALMGIGPTNPVEWDVHRAQTSLEIQIVAATKIAQIVEDKETPEAVEPQLQEIQKPDPVEETIVANKEQGALAEFLPSHLRNPPPVYPRLARQSGYEGTVLLKVEVLPTGRAGQIQISQSCGYPMLDREALRAIQKWRFNPAQQLGSPVSAWVELPITFKLQ